MKRLPLLLLLLLAAACSREPAAPAATATYDERVPIGVWYVAAPSVAVRAQQNETSAVLATYPGGEAVTVLSRAGEWAEVRTGDRSGWVKWADLQTKEAMETAEENPQPKFQRMPLPVSAPSATGAIYIEADVNSEGEVTAVRTLENTTGSEALAFQNGQALKAARFYPIVVQGQKKPFKYYHRVTY